jgi:penicillin-binding protein 1A
VFANGGYKIQPYLISKIQDGDGKVISETKTPEMRIEDNRVLDPRNAFVVDSMLRDVTRYGTGAEATRRLARGDIAGKTGTTSDAMDGWFAGYGGGVVAVAWLGYDDPRSLGGKEFGATLALPIWIDYMQVALHKRPQEERAVPDGVVRENDDWVYAEFAETPELKAIDLDQAAPVQEGPPTMTAAAPPAGAQAGQLHPLAQPDAPVRPLPAPPASTAPVRPLPPPAASTAPVRPLPMAPDVAHPPAVTTTQ